MNDEKIKQSSFVEHLTELRSRLVKSIIYLFIFFIVCYFFAENIYGFLLAPYAEAVKDDEVGRRMIFTALQETFITYLKVAFFAAMFIASPIILTQIWKFVAPGLYKNEKKALLPYLIATPVLFLLGGMLVYYLIMPLAIKFFLSFETSAHLSNLPIQLEAKVNEYLSLIMRLIFTALHETFITYLKVAFFAAMFVTSPIILTQIWKFIAPGLYKDEKKTLLPYLIATPVLFLLGGMLVYYLIMPLAIKFFLSFETSIHLSNLPIQLEAKVNEYLSLIMRLIFAFGISFQLPVLLSLLARVGFINSQYLKKRRKYVIIIIFTVAAVLTPPDPITQIGLGIPLLILYELSILSVRLMEKKKNNA